MRIVIGQLLLLNIWNGSVFAMIKLGDVRDLVAITLGVVSIFSTALIALVNLRKLRNKNHEDN
jgi:hypothetical protein